MTTATRHNQETSGYVPPYPLASGQEKSWTSEEEFMREKHKGNAGT